MAVVFSDDLERFDHDWLLCTANVNKRRAGFALGILGGGNHFIEVDEVCKGIWWKVADVVNCDHTMSTSTVLSLCFIRASLVRR